MEIPAKELLLDIILGQGSRHIIPYSLAAEEEAVDWLFHLLHYDEFPADELIEFLRKHRPEDPRFVRWKNRAFRPGLGEDGMVSEKAYRFIEKHEPGHPWLDPFMEQAAYGFRELTSGIYLGKGLHVPSQEPLRKFGRQLRPWRKRRRRIPPLWRHGSPSPACSPGSSSSPQENSATGVSSISSLT